VIRALIATLMVASSWPAAAQTISITGGTVALGDGSDPIAGGTVVIRNGRIAAAGANVSVPPGAQVMRRRATGGAPTMSLQTRVRVGCSAQSGEAPAVAGFAAGAKRFVN